MLEKMTVVVCPSCHCSECKVFVKEDSTMYSDIRDIFIKLNCPVCHQSYSYFDTIELTIH